MVNVISLYLLVAAIITCFFTAYILTRGRSSYIRIFSALVFCCCIYLLGYLLEFCSTDLEQMYFWNQIQYFSIPFFACLWLLVALLYTKRISILRGWHFTLLFLIPLLTFFFRLTNSFHHLYYQAWEVQQFNGHALLILEKGPWYYVHTVYIFLAMICTNILYYLEYRRSSRYDQFRCLILLTASLLPCMGIVLNIYFFRELGIDYAALFIPISIILMIIATLKYDFLEIKILADEAIFDKNSDGMVLLDKKLRVMDYNKAAQNIFFALGIRLQNYPVENILGRQQELLEIMKSEDSREFHFNQGGQDKFFEISSVVLNNSSERNVGMLKSIRDITVRKKLQESLKFLATIDGLSGLCNREHFMHLARMEFERVKGSNQVFSLMMMDVDYFKTINDTEGHAAGDQVIREMGRLIPQGFKNTDIFGRLGGDEFMVLMTNTSLDEARLVVEKFRETVEKTRVVYQNQEIRLTISAGLVSYFPEAQGVEELLKYADEAMYQSKTLGRNRCQVAKRLGA